MDVLYYSNHCKHSKKILQSLGKTNLREKISFICIDNRYLDNKTNQIFIILDNGKQLIMPPNLKKVPALLLVNDKFRILLGDSIIEHLRPDIISQNEASVSSVGGEPFCYTFNHAPNNIVSEQYTYFDMSPDELSAKGTGDRRQMHNYVSVQGDKNLIKTPEDTYKPNKVSGDLTIEDLQQQRNTDLGQSQKPPIPDFTY
tara:strand:- start:229 stop:828 length:600 start_codon:yes stop_codon:yes gene_type:complete